ncbi:hypothetical protein A3K86_19840 [Photobacterium jeanii]|uniref:Aerotolerance protein BatD n=1 Tax=Photobacterium jeanii TaxID=858640 RepID=A0A178K3B9_9GAMM|nr:BatD family protein [Photobacterium jeanii]OAN11212.1 hypothetical protein A3K86_19840 [Photobacterium jeanii]
MKHSTPSQLRHWMTHFVIAIASLIAFSAQAAQVEATVSKNIVAVNEVFQLEISIDSNVNPDSLALSALDKDFTYGRPSVSSNSSYINGVVSRTTQWRLAVAAKAVGTFTIPAFRIGATESEPISIQVLKSANSQASANDPKIKLSSKLEKQSLYVGESTKLTVKILIAEQIDQAALVAPKAEGIDIIQLGDDKQAERILNGRRYIEITRQYQLTPQQAGNIVLSGAEFKTNLVRGSRGFGSTLSIPFSKQTDDITLNVKAKPSNYQGLWLPTTDLQLDQNWQPEITTSEFKVGEPITRIITLRIKHVAQSNMPNINIDYPRSVRVYDEKPVYGERDGYTSMMIKQVIIPRTAGELTLPPLKINWWDTNTNQQQTTTVDGITVKVLEGDNSNNVQLPVLDDSQVAPATQVEQPPAEVKIVKDAGMWPWLTAIMTSLWLLTLGMWFKARQRNPLSQSQDTATKAKPTIAQSDEAKIAQLIDAVNHEQTMQVQTLFKQLDRNAYQDDYLVQLEQAINQMMAAHYGQQPKEWDKQTLLSLLAAAKENKQSSANKQVLASLVPEKTQGKPNKR